MFFNVFLPYVHSSHIANLMSYISFRSAMAMAFSFAVSFFMGPWFITQLRNIQKTGQPIRIDGPDTHFAKAGTPTMGGIMIIFSTFFSSILFTDLTNSYIWLVLFVLISFGSLGFVDDYTKVTQNNYKGINAKTKILFQMIVSLIVFFCIIKFSDHQHVTYLSIPFMKNLVLDIGYFYFPLTIFILIGSSNAVNLTDGLDGLAIGAVAIAMTSFALISYLVGNSIYSQYLQVTHIPNAGELTVLCSAIVGSCLGFLWYNCKPAEIFMGDTGSLSLGGALGAISVITKHELVLAIVGGLFVIETLSVIMQVLYFKRTKGKRFFLMAPLHHHFEKKGWSEPKIVVRFWILAIIFALIGLSSLKLR